MDSKEPEQLKKSKKRRILKHPKSQMNIKITPKLRSELKIKCGEEGVSQTDYIESAIYAKLHNKDSTTIMEKQIKRLTVTVAGLDATMADMSDKVERILSIIEK